MTNEKSFFFDSVNGDRMYTAQEFNDFFALFFTDGVIGLGENLEVVHSEEPYSVKVKPGEAVVGTKGYALTGEEPVTLSFPKLEDGRPRIDRVVLRRDNTSEKRQVYLTTLQGNPAENPLPPKHADELEKNIFEICLAQVLLEPGNHMIEQITDERDDPRLCGVSQTTIDSVTIEEFKDKFEEFTELFAQYQQKYEQDETAYLQFKEEIYNRLSGLTGKLIETNARTEGITPNQIEVVGSQYKTAIKPADDDGKGLQISVPYEGHTIEEWETPVVRTATIEVKPQTLEYAGDTEVLIKGEYPLFRVGDSYGRIEAHNISADVIDAKSGLWVSGSLDVYSNSDRSGRVYFSSDTDFTVAGTTTFYSIPQFRQGLIIQPQLVFSGSWDPGTTKASPFTEGNFFIAAIKSTSSGGGFATVVYVAKNPSAPRYIRGGNSYTNTSNNPEGYALTFYDEVGDGKNYKYLNGTMVIHTASSNHGARTSISITHIWRCW